MNNNNNLNIYIYLKNSIDLNSRELDIKLNIEFDIKSNIKSDTGLDIKLDFKAKKILKDITKLEKEGPVKLNYTTYTKKL